ncbi:MAG: hypothetical protein WC614_12980 [bacterium]
MKKTIKTICIFAILSFSTFASAVTIDDISQKLEQNIAKIKDMQADIEIKTNMDAGKQVVKKMQILSKGTDKIKVTTIAPQKQAIIFNDKKMQIEDSNGKKTIINKDSLSQGQLQAMSPKDMNPQRSITNFLKDGKSKIINSNGNIYTLEIIPNEKDKNPLMEKAELQVDYAKGLIINQKLYSNMGISITDISYKKIGNTWVMNKMEVTTPMGLTGKSAMITVNYDNIKVNQGISDKIFTIENNSIQK